MEKSYLQIVYLIRDLYLEYIKNTYNSTTTQNPNNPIKTQAKYLNRHFSKEESRKPIETKKMLSISNC